LIVFLLPILLLLLFLVFRCSENLSVWAILLAVAVFLISASLYSLARLIFGILSPISSLVRDLETRHETTDIGSRAGEILESLKNLGHYLHTWEEHQNRLEILQKQANLNAYQSQINPHFLYNMLDTIRGQALDDGSTATSDMIEALSKMMRYTISDKNSMVTLGTEIKSVDNYIKIQQFRFGNRFQYIVNLDELDSDMIEMKIPKMTLQPIIENALTHGVASLVSEGEIKLLAFNTQSRLIIQISDNGVGMDEEQLRDIRKKLASDKMDSSNGLEDNDWKRGMGIALNNVNSRIKLAFGAKYGLSVYGTKGVGAMLEITLPIIKGQM
jgi:two-component system sensor histidine kinase YesM